MPSQQPAAIDSSDRKPPFDELRWVIQIRNSLEDELEEDDGVPVSIFNVPKTLLSSKPEAYAPQLISLGPYHHWRRELYDMERYKLSAAKRTQRHLPNAKFQHLVDSLAKHEHRIRAHYHRYLDFNGETLAWMMAVDACFLLEFLQIYAIEEGGKVLERVSSRMSHLVDNAGRKSAHNIILRDIVMLENQVPLFLLRKLLVHRYPSSELGDDALAKMVTGFMKELCPFKTMESFPCIDVAQHSHLLELLYRVLVPKSEEQGNHNDEIEEENEGGGDAQDEQWKGESTYVRQLLGVIWGYASGANGGPVRYIKEALVSRPVTFVVKAPWKIVTSLPGFSILKQPVEHLFSQAKASSSKREEDDNPSSSHNANKPPLAEEIMIPSVAELLSAGVRFCPTSGGITSVNFDAKTAIFYLPAVSLDVNTEVILRNLVAYEAAASGGPLVFTRYTELMNGIIDTEEDVRVLRKSGVVVNRMKSDGDAASLWNGMSRSVRLTRVGFLDRVIEDVNRYHASRWTVRTEKLMKKYVFRSWPFLTFLAALLMLLLTGLQSFCSVYGCARWFNVPGVGKQ